MYKILLKECEIFAYHGVHEFERKEGQLFLIDAELDCMHEGDFADDLSDTIDYTAVYSIIKKEMDSPAQLLEVVVQRMIKSLFEYSPSIEKVMVRLTKKNPPIEGFKGSLGIEMIREREKVRNNRL